MENRPTSVFLGVIRVKAILDHPQGPLKKGRIPIRLIKNDSNDLGQFVLYDPDGNEKIGSLESEVNLVLGLASTAGHFFDPEQLSGTLSGDGKQTNCEISIYGDPFHKAELISILKIKNIVYSKDETRPNEPTPLTSLFTEALAIQEQGDLMKACEAISTKLHPHQMIALNWMFNREVHPPTIPFWVKKEDGTYISLLTQEKRQVEPPSCVRGGILADDMGLGKTLSLIALIMTNFYDGKPLAHPLYGHKRKPFSCLRTPFVKMEKQPAVLSNKENEAVKPVSSKDKVASLKNMNVFRFFDKSSSDEEEGEQPTFEIDDNDDYGELPSPFNNENSVDSASHPLNEDTAEDDKIIISNKRASSDKPGHSPEHKKSKIESSSDLNSSTVDVDEIDDNFTQRLIIPPKYPSKWPGEVKATLIVCPLSLLHHWISEFDKHVDKSVDLDLFMHYGESKGKKGSYELERCHVVVTTYGTLSSEYRKDESLSSSETSPILHARWLRVILDEGHLVRNVKTQAAKSVLALKAERKWIITGTPIQNKLKELYSLVNWLGIPPFKDNKKIWNDLIERERSTEGVSRLQVLLTSICMRRVKNDRLNGRPLVQLPPRTFLERRVSFKGQDAQIHEVLRDEGFKFIEKLIHKGILNRHFGYVFALLMKMRLYCCHPELISLDLRNKLKEHLKKGLENLTDIGETFGKDLDPETASELNEALKDALSSEDDPEKSCPICLDTLTNETASITQCKHVFCIKCLKNFFSSTSNTSVCPLCRSSIQPEKISLILKDEEEDGPDADMEDAIETTHDSPKLLAVLEELQNIPEMDKVVIVSQFTSFLSMIHPLLKKENYDFVRLDGTMNLRQRGEVLDNFNRGSPRILLLSLKAGGIGLNLISANHLLLLDPAWNPADEDQVFDRIYRIGQVKPVFVYKYIVENSVEDRILALQKRKRELAKTAFNRNVTSHSLKEERIKNFKVLVGLEQ